MEKVGQAGANRWRAKARCCRAIRCLIQKTLADKLSDKVQVIIAPPAAAAGFLAANLPRGGAPSAVRAEAQHAAPADGAPGRGGLSHAMATANHRRRPPRPCLATCDRHTTDHGRAALPRRASRRRSRRSCGKAKCCEGAAAKRLDYLQVRDHRRERGGFVKASQVNRAGLTAAEAPAQLLAVLRFRARGAGRGSAGIGVAAAWLQAAPAEAVRGPRRRGAGCAGHPCRAAGAARLGRAAGQQGGQAALSAHLEVAPATACSSPATSRRPHAHLLRRRAFRRVLALPAQPRSRRARRWR
jgi:hypothetical protein